MGAGVVNDRTSEVSRNIADLDDLVGVGEHNRSNPFIQVPASEIQ
jgi:hypothetical protein